jgi:DNA-binding IclR family transcriptional regulator
MPSDERRAPSPQSVTRVIRILEALCASEGPVSLADLSRLLATPKSSLSALLRGLADEDFVVAVDGTWRLGPGAFGLGGALIEARRRQQSPDVLREGMRRLAASTGETVLFAVSDGDGMTMSYVDVVESSNAVRFAVKAGDRRPLYSTAGGRVLLAAGTEADLQRYLDGLRPEKVAGETETDKRRLAAIVADVREQGFAQTVDQAADGVTGTAAPVRDADGSVIGALVAAAPSSRSHDRCAELARLVRKEARAVSRNLGWREPPA